MNPVDPSFKPGDKPRVEVELEYSFTKGQMCIEALTVEDVMHCKWLGLRDEHGAESKAVKQLQASIEKAGFSFKRPVTFYRKSVGVKEVRRVQ